jgi:hypothetical protein
VLAAENLLGVFGVAAAGGGVERVDGAARVGGDDAARLLDGAVGERVLGGLAAVNLRANGREQVEAG